MSPGGTVKVTPPKDGSVEVIDDGKGTPKKDGGLDDKGFVPLFNGKDLTGWKTHLAHDATWDVLKRGYRVHRQEWLSLQRAVTRELPMFGSKR